jgi:nucleotide-binding universal stress UspA family protein
MIRRILVAVDSSPRASGVLSAAREIAEAFQAELRVFQVIHVPVDIPPAGQTNTDDVEVRELARTQRELMELAGNHPRIVVEVPVITDRAVWRPIVERANQPDIDLLVIGSHGYSSLERLMGTTAAQVANRSTCSVFIVRSPETS